MPKQAPCFTQYKNNTESGCGVSLIQNQVSSLLQQCAVKEDIDTGRQVLHFLITNGMESSAHVQAPLISMFAACRSLPDANSELCSVSNPSHQAWSAIISAHASHGENQRVLELYQQMQENCAKPDKSVFLQVLKVCGSLNRQGQGRLVHDNIVRSGLDLDVFLGSTLIDMYAKCEALEDAHRLLEYLPNKNVVAWNAMLAGYAKHGHGLLALKLFHKMQEEGVFPGACTFSSTLKACGSIEDLGQGMIIHSQIILSKLEADLVVASTLVDLYIKCRMLKDALKVFNRLKVRDLLSWNAIIAGCVQHGEGHSALELFEQMQKKGKSPDRFTFSCIPKACGIIKSTEKGKLIHEQIIRLGLQSDHAVGNALVDMYAKCGCLNEARNVFDNLVYQDIVSWNTMLAGYAQHGQGFLALELFERFQKKDVKGDQATFSSILKACGIAGATRHGQLIHDLVIRHGFDGNMILENTLIDMYARCGVLDEAAKVLTHLARPTSISWGALVAGYALHGKWIETQQCLGRMLSAGVEPDSKIFTSILTACSHAGQLQEGYLYFISLKTKYRIILGIEHFNCMVDLLGRSGFLKEAEQLLHTIPFPPDVVGWRTLLTACRLYGNRELGRRSFEMIVHLSPDVAAGYELISSLYANINFWDDVNEVQDLRKSVGAWKKPGRACIEIKNEVHEFVVSDITHLFCDKAHIKLCALRRMIVERGFMPDLDLVLELSQNNEETKTSTVYEKM